MLFTLCLRDKAFLVTLFLLYELTCLVTLNFTYNNKVLMSLMLPVKFVKYSS